MIYAEINEGTAIFYAGMAVKSDLSVTHIHRLDERDRIVLTKPTPTVSGDLSRSDSIVTLNRDGGFLSAERYLPT